MFASLLEKVLGRGNVYANCYLYHGVSGKYCICCKYLDRVLFVK